MFKANEIDERLIGISGNGYTYENPASYSALGKVKFLGEEVGRLREVINLLMDELGYELETGTRLIKKKKKK